MATLEDIPSQTELLVPVLRAVETLGGQAKIADIKAAVTEQFDPGGTLIKVTPDSEYKQPVLHNRTGFAASTCKRAGMLAHEEPGQPYRLTLTGRDTLTLSEEKARETIKRRANENKGPLNPPPVLSARPRSLKQAALAGLGDLSEAGFQRFAFDLLASHKIRVKATGNPGAAAVTGYGIAPAAGQTARVLSRNLEIAVQVKLRKDEDVGEDTVVLFAKNAGDRGADLGIMVSLGRYTKQAQKAASGSVTRVELVDAERLWELMKETGFGLRRVLALRPGFLEQYQTP